MKIAAFNVENLFDRARVFNRDSENATQEILDAVAEINGLFERDIYTDEVLDRMRELIEKLDLAKSDEGTYVPLYSKGLASASQNLQVLLQISGLRFCWTFPIAKVNGKSL
ncbi:hypothetical protein [Myxosarcina sp. GI1]|uniref:hypothetical protein n=1 Tax=Myxosarcina sp. GI1 TaxID=1541065 RepID=UPI00055E8770|nr:hypothetical protein [Myxosarcina sp. GI1]